MTRVWEEVDEEEFKEFRKQVNLYSRPEGNVFSTEKRFVDVISFLLYMDMKSKEKLQRSADRLTIMAIVLSVRARHENIY